MSSFNYIDDYPQTIKENRKFSQYRLYQGAFENQNKCKYDRFYHPYDLVDVESELKNQTRPLSNNPKYKYGVINKDGQCQTKDSYYFIENKNTGKTYQQTTCSLNGHLNTFNKTIPIVYPPEVCPIVYNNIPSNISKGF